MKQQPKSFRGVGRKAARHLKVTVAAALVAAFLAPLATAADCTKKTRDDKAGTLGIHTKVKNDTSKSLKFKLTKCKPGDCTVLQTKTLGPGEKLDEMIKGGAWTIDLDINNVLACTYTIERDGTSSTWDPDWNSLVDGPCEPGQPRFRYECDRAFNPDKNRWNTTFTIRDK